MNISINLHKVSRLCSHHLFGTINFTPTSQAVISWWVFPPLLCFPLPFQKLGVSNYYHCVPWVEREPFHSSSLTKGKSHHTPLITGPCSPSGLSPNGWLNSDTILSACSPSQQSKLGNMELELVSASSKTKNKGYLSSPGSHLSSPEISSRKIKSPPISCPFREATPTKP